MSKVILLVFVVFFAATNGQILGEIFQAIHNGAQEGVKLVRGICNDAARRRIEVEKSLIQAKYDFLTSLRGMIGQNYQKTYTDLYNVALKEVAETKKQAIKQETRLDRTRPADSQCLRDAQYLVENLEYVRSNIEQCRDIAVSEDNKRIHKIDQVKDRAMATLNALEASLNDNTCIASIHTRLRAFGQTLISSVELTAASTEINDEHLMDSNKFSDCIKEYGYNDFKKSAPSELISIEQCIDKELSGAGSSGT